ncbi:hypothetical protein PENTCL1PPCAC_14110, partial [Pristionchus entomophagus]
MERATTELQWWENGNFSASSILYHLLTYSHSQLGQAGIRPEVLHEVNDLFELGIVPSLEQSKHHILAGGENRARPFHLRERSKPVVRRSTRDRINDNVHGEAPIEQGECSLKAANVRLDSREDHRLVMLIHQGHHGGSAHRELRLVDHGSSLRELDVGYRMPQALRVLLRADNGHLEQFGRLDESIRDDADVVKVGNRLPELLLHVAHEEHGLVLIDGRVVVSGQTTARRPERIRACNNCGRAVQLLCLLQLHLGQGCGQLRNSS